MAIIRWPAFAVTMARPHMHDLAALRRRLRQINRMLREGIVAEELLPAFTERQAEIRQILEAERQRVVVAANKGSKRSSETRAKMSAGQNRAKLSARARTAEARAKLAAALHTPETRAKAAAARRTPATRAKMSAAQKRRAPPTAETRAKMSAISKALWERPDYRERVGPKMGAAWLSYTCIKGRKIRMKSKFESAAADWLDAHGYGWEYEPRPAPLKGIYIRDFRLADGRLIEVKGMHRRKGLHKVRQARALGYRVILIDIPFMRRLGIAVPA